MSNTATATATALSADAANVAAKTANVAANVSQAGTLACYKSLHMFLLVMFLQVSKNLPEITQKTDIAPESVGAKANARN